LQQEVRKALKSVEADAKVKKELTQDGGVVLLATPLHFPLADFLSSLAPFTQIFRYNFDKPLHPPPLMGPASAPAEAQADPGEVAAAFIVCDTGAPSYLKENKSFDDALARWKTAVKEMSE
jgi:hypothetical protein